MITTLYVSKVRHGKQWHAYESGGDRLSLCGRTPNTETYIHNDLTRITCEHCMRIVTIIEHACLRATGTDVATPAAAAPSTKSRRGNRK